VAGKGLTIFGVTAGRLCLDFANTVEGRRTPTPRERVGAYAELVEWARQAGVLTAGEARALARRGRRRPASSAAVLRRARSFREALYRVVSATAGRRLPLVSDVITLDVALRQATVRSRLVAAADRFTWVPVEGPLGLDRPLWAVARSAAEVLASADLGSVRECLAPECGCLFLDTSRNRSRRWCDMAGCGNRAKARRYWARKRSMRVRSAGGKS